MQNAPNEKSKTIIWAGATLIAALLGIAGGLAIATAVLDTGSSGADARALESQSALAEAQDQIKDLQATLTERQGANQEVSAALEDANRLEGSLRTQLALAVTDTASALEEIAELEPFRELYSSAQEEAASLEAQLTDVKREMELAAAPQEKLVALAQAVEAHRLLLVELRKDIPETRGGAVGYWKKIRSLASTADPALASPVDRVILRIDSYYDWNDRSPDPSASSQEYVDWVVDYGLSGALDYDDAVEVFKKEALLAVIGQLDSVVLKLD